MKRKRGRPVTTGSKVTPVVSFRLSADQHADLKVLARRTGLTTNGAAKAGTLMWLRAERDKSTPGTE